MKNLPLKIILTVVLSLPSLFFLMFLFGEVFSGDMSGFSHIIQAAPFLILMYLLWRKKPKNNKRK